MSFFRGAQEAASAATAGAQANATAQGIAGSVMSAGSRFQSFARNAASEAQVRAGLLTGRSTSQVIPHDGVACEGCGLSFGVVNRKHLCGSCDRYLCASCLGSTGWVPAFSCFCASRCPRCREAGTQVDEFKPCRTQMEEGVGVTLSLPPKKNASFFAGGSNTGSSRQVAVWLSLDSSTNDLVWGTLEQKQGRPAEEGRFSVCDVIHVNDTGKLLELYLKNETQAMTMEFLSPDEKESWARNLRLAVDVLTPFEERDALEAARREHRHRIAEERRSQNEDRKKKLSENLGMRFTAEAMLNR